MGKNQRKWRNILLDRNFQLSFTVLLVGLAALLMALLGFWVKDVAYESTLVGENHLHPICADLEDAVNNPPVPMDAPTDKADPPVVDGDADAKDGDAKDGDAKDGDAKDGDAKDGDAKDGDAPAAGSAGDETSDNGERPRTKVVIEDTHMEIMKPAPEPAVVKPPEPDPKLVADLERCRERKNERVAGLWSSYRLILIVLFGASVFLILGLAVHGLRMTHKVAGPLFKVGLYLAKLKRGVYDQVWNLRKGDQLLEFYEHFRAAHRELTHMQADDIAVLEKVIAAADEGKLDDASPELKAALADLRELLEAKKEGLKVPEDKRG